MSRLSHRQLDRHIDEQEEEIQWQREQDKLDAHNEALNIEILHEKALAENERIRLREEREEYLDECFRRQLEAEMGYDPYEDEYRV